MIPTLGGVHHLDGEYTVFGEVIEGLDVIDKITALRLMKEADLLMTPKS